MGKLRRRREECLAFVLGQIFATSVVLKEISGHSLPFLSIAPLISAIGRWVFQSPTPVRGAVVT